MDERQFRDARRVTVEEGVTKNEKGIRRCCPKSSKALSMPSSELALTKRIGVPSV